MKRKYLGRRSDMTRMPARRFFRAVAATLVPAVCAVTTVGCGEGSGRGTWGGTVDTLPGGVVLVSNPGEGLWGREPAWRLVEELRIGSVEEAGPALFARVHDLAIDRSGRIYVLDHQYQEIRVFEPDGSHLRTIGGRGGGPGEFRQAYGMDIDPQGRAWVVDMGQRAYSVFDTSAAYLTGYPRHVSVFGFRWSGGFTTDGRLLDYALTAPSAGEPAPVLVRYDTAARAFVDTFPIPRAQAERDVFDLRDERGMGSIVAVPFASGVHWKVGPEGLMWTGDSERYRVYIASLAGDTVRAIERSYKPVPVTAAERDSALEPVRKAAGGRPVDAGKVPRVRPAFRRFDVDDRGFLWVWPSLPRGVTGVVFDVFDPDGRYLGQVSTGNRFASYAPLEIRGDRLYGVDQDTLGVQYVVRMRIEGR